MIKSMTAYGRITRPSSIGRWLVEIHSVNRKTLDFTVHLPKDFLQFDIEIRKWLSQAIKRGQVTVKINLCCEGMSTEFLQMKMNHLKSFKNCLEKAAMELGYSSQEITFPFLFEQLQSLSNGVDIQEKEDTIRKELQASIEEALKPFLKMRECEGKALALELEKHLQILQNYLQDIEKRAGKAEDKYRKKILDRLQEFKLMTKEDQERVLREVVLYAEKIDISEEIARLKSHIQQFLSLLISEESSVGRTMDFLIQEMGREINTLAAKSDDADISFAALKIKSEIEKIREQAQNIE
jgi:uncharacterized protein (TIGR00255 family)